jgi:hypothetical protein
MNLTIIKTMRKIFILLMTVMGTLQLQAQDQNFWVFLCFGQSNMAGQAPIEQQDLTVSERYLSMATTGGADRKLGTWRKAVPPLCRADAHLGPVDWFGRTLLDVVPDARDADSGALYSDIARALGASDVRRLEAAASWYPGRTE